MASFAQGVVSIVGMFLVGFGVWWALRRSATLRRWVTADPRRWAVGVAVVAAIVFGGAHLWATDCVTQYEHALIDAQNKYSQCLASAASGSVFVWPFQQSMCQAEYLARIWSAETQFAACSGIGMIK